MPFDSDVVLLGTGVAPLVAASQLISQGKSVLLLNPDPDFFLEESELPLDPLLPRITGRIEKDQFQRSTPEKALEELLPNFPGAVEYWSASSTKEGYHDLQAPHVRGRGRLWLAPAGRVDAWEPLEELYIETSDAGFNPQIFEGLQAASRFPGYSSGDGAFRGVYVPKLCDVDVSRYRNGLLEFVRERLGPERVVCDAGQIELMPGGLRFYTNGKAKTAQANEGILVFWTPKLSSWVLKQAKKAEVTPEKPVGVRLWEEWTLVSKSGVDPSIVGIFSGAEGELAVWAAVEGPLPPAEAPAPKSPAAEGAYPLKILRPGPLLDLDSAASPVGGLSWANDESFRALFELCGSFLKWDRISVSSMKAHAIFEWEKIKKGRPKGSPWKLLSSEPKVHVIPLSDGPLTRVVHVARKACTLLGSGETS